MTAAFLHPYGAFELKSGARGRMAVAAAGSALLVVVAIVSAVALIGLANRFVRPDAIPKVDFPSFRVFTIPPSTGGGAPPSNSSSPLDGTIVPVADPANPSINAPSLADIDAVSSKMDGGTGPLTPVVGIDPGRMQVKRQPDEFSVAYVEEYPQLLHAVEPQYPELAREAGLEGQVRLKVLVGTDGLVKDVVVLSGKSVLNEAAVAAARRYTFRPAYTNHRPVPVWVGIPMTFRLTGN